MTVKSCMPPDSSPIRPTFTMPAGACDAHCHVFGPAAEFPYHANSTYHPPDAGKDRLAALHKHLRIDRAVIVQASCHGPDNRAMVDALRHSGGRWKGVCIADATFTDSDFEELADAGVRGVRFNFVTHLGGTPNLDVMQRIVERVKPLGWHLIIHVNAEDIVRFEDFFARFDLPIIVDHMGRVPAADGVGQKAFGILLDFMQRDNWWVKVCGAERISGGGPPFYDAIPYAQALIDVAPDRVLWGTDFPHPNITRWMPNDGELVDLVPLFARDAATRQKILVDNPARLYGFEA